MWQWLDSLFTDPRYRDVLVNEAEEWVRPKGPLRRQEVAVPDVRGMIFREAWERLMLAGFRVRVQRLEPNPAPEDGVVVAQDPAPGTMARRKTRVRLSVLHPTRKDHRA